MLFHPSIMMLLVLPNTKIHWCPDICLWNSSLSNKHQTPFKISKEGILCIQQKIQKVSVSHKKTRRNYSYHTYTIRKRIGNHCHYEETERKIKGML